MSTMILDSFDTARVVRRPAARSTVRLTRRGRVVVFAFALIVMAVLGLVGASVAGAAGRGDELRTRTVTVAPGTTLWDLASHAAHGGDVLAMEQEIVQLNHLDGGMLISGQRLRIPA